MSAPTIWYRKPYSMSSANQLTFSPPKKERTRDSAERGRQTECNTWQISKKSKVKIRSRKGEKGLNREWKMNWQCERISGCQGGSLRRQRVLQLHAGDVVVEGHRHHLLHWADQAVLLTAVLNHQGVRLVRVKHDVVGRHDHHPSHHTLGDNKRHEFESLLLWWLFSSQNGLRRGHSPFRQWSTCSSSWWTWQWRGSHPRTGETAHVVTVLLTCRWSLHPVTLPGNRDERRTRIKLITLVWVFLIKDNWLTCDTFSDSSLIEVGSEEPTDWDSASDWPTSGTNSFCKGDGQACLPIRKPRLTAGCGVLSAESSPVPDRHCGKRGGWAAPICWGWCWTSEQCCLEILGVPPATWSYILGKCLLPKVSIYPSQNAARKTKLESRNLDSLNSMQPFCYIISLQKCKKTLGKQCGQT